MPKHKPAKRRVDSNYLRLTQPPKPEPIREKPLSLGQQAKQIFSISHDTYFRQRFVWEHGSQEVKEQMNSGEISVNKAYLLTRPSVKKQKRISRGTYKLYQNSARLVITITTNPQNLDLITRTLERLGIESRDQRPEND